MFRLAHLSDLHIGPLPRPRLADLAGKRLTGYLNWQRGRRHHHRMEALFRLIDDIHAAEPDMVAVTGDLINLGLAAEYLPARTVLARIGEPEKVMAVPGNHDAYMRATEPLIRTTWGPWLASDPDLADPSPVATLFPSFRRRGDVALIGLSSGVPKPAFVAAGTLGPAQIAAAGRLLERAGREGLARVVLIHHPPFPIGARGELTDHRRLWEIVREHGAELILHGHTHKGTISELTGPHGDVPVIGVPSASAHGHGEHAAWNDLTITREGPAWRIDLTRRQLSNNGLEVAPVLSQRFLVQAPR